MDTLSSEFTQIKELLLNLQPDDRGPVPSGDSTTRGSPCRDIDVLSTAASCSLFDDEGEGHDKDKNSVFQPLTPCFKGLMRHCVDQKLAMPH